MGFLFLTLEALKLQDIMPGYAYFCLNLYCRWIYNACFGKKKSNCVSHWNSGGLIHKTQSKFSVLIQVLCNTSTFTKWIIISLILISIYSLTYKSCQMRQEFPVRSAEIRFHLITLKHQPPDSTLCSFNDQVVLYPIPPFSGYRYKMDGVHTAWSSTMELTSSAPLCCKWRCYTTGMHNLSFSSKNY